MKFSFLNSEKIDKDDEVVLINIKKVVPNPYQPRTNFNTEDIKELADSIKNFGVIQPLTVRPNGEKYELIAGERRLRASKYIGLEKVPAIINDFDEQEMAEISLVENLQRKDLDFVEEAIAYSRLLKEFDLTQKELAEKLGKSQSTIANKLRILKFSPDVLDELKSPLISERHARALLKITEESEQFKIIEKIKEKELTVRETEKLIKKSINKEEKEEGRIVTVFKDLRVFKNTLNKTIKEMELAGLDVKVDKREDDDFVEYSIRLPRKNNGGDTFE